MPWSVPSQPLPVDERIGYYEKSFFLANVAASSSGTLSVSGQESAAGIGQAVYMVRAGYPVAMFIGIETAVPAATTVVFEVLVDGVPTGQTASYGPGGQGGVVEIVGVGPLAPNQSVQIAYTVTGGGGWTSNVKADVGFSRHS